MNLYQEEIFSDKIFYHVYPLGLGNCPKQNNFTQCAGNFFETFAGDLDRIKKLGCNAIYLGPIFESTKHGYDTIDYYHVDRRLGNNEKFKAFVECAHQKGFSIILDAVFNHTGRDFFAFKDLQQKGFNSEFKDWYLNINFSNKSPYGDNFSYEGWAGCYDLIKLNLKNCDVKNHIFGAVKFWIEEFKIDGLRFDAADVLDKTFIEEISQFTRNLKDDFWLMGEVVHGNYNDWVSCNRLDSVTNYQLYRSIFASVDQNNFFDISYNLKREFDSSSGCYKFAPLYNFLDNHDIDRVASVIKNPKDDLYMIYALLFTVPGIPSIYYGSEFALYGKRNNSGDEDLRPALKPFAEPKTYLVPQFDASFLADAISDFAKIRMSSKAIQKGNYVELLVKNEQFVFERNFYDDQNNLKEKVIAIFNNSSKEEKVSVLPKDFVQNYKDMISGANYSPNDLQNLTLSAKSVMILRSW